MSLLSRQLDLDGNALNPGPIYDAVLGPNNDLYTAVRASIGTTSLYKLENARGEASFEGTLAVSGGTADLLDLGDAIGAVIRRPGPDAFANSTIFLQTKDVNGTGFIDDVTLVTGRVTNPSTAETSRGFAISYENSAIGRGDEFIQFHESDGDLIQSINVGAQFKAEMVGLKGGNAVFLAEDSSGTYGQIYNGRGNEVGDRFDTEAFIAATATRNGGFALATELDGETIRILQYNASGNRISPPIDVDVGLSPTTGPWDGETLAFTETSKGLFALNYLAETFDDAFFRTVDDAVLTVVTKQGNVVEGPIELLPDTGQSETNPGFAALRGDATLVTMTPNDLPRSNLGFVLEAPDRIIDGKGRINTLNGNAKNDLIQGRGSDDRIDGKNGNDILFGDTENDTVLGGNGSDRVDGGLGNDRVEGQNGNDLVFGRAGNDTLRGGNGKDTLDGGNAKDREFGGGGADTFWMSAGNDTLTGGKGSDTFLFYEAGTGKDVLTDFERGKDTILVTGYDDDDVAVVRAGKNVRVEFTNPDDASDVSTLLVQNAKVAQVEAALDFA